MWMMAVLFISPASTSGTKIDRQLSPSPSSKIPINVSYQPNSTRKLESFHLSGNGI
jgi:hypothetical protein